jgi:hypothetical protein
MAEFGGVLGRQHAAGCTGRGLLGTVNVTDLTLPSL